MNLIKAIKNPKSYIKIGAERVKNSFHKYFYKGTNVYCTICTWEGKLFFNQKCPKCSSLARTRLVPFSLKHFGLIRTQLNILHIAPSMNEYNYVKKNFNNPICYDRLDIKQRKHTNIKQSITETNINNNVYDLVIAWHVFEHIKEDLKAISEIYRVLKPNGNLLLSVPIYPLGNAVTYEDSKIEYKDYTKVHGHYDHYRSCGLDYYKRFEKNGFKSNTFIVNSLDQSKIDYFGLRPDHIVWCFNK